MSEIQRTPKVLVVEDEAVTRELLVQMLQTGGFEVLAADTGERAFRMMRAWRGRLDLLFTETRLPGLVDGWILGDEFRRSHPQRPIIYAAAGEAAPSQQAADAALVRKPVSVLDVLALVKRLTEALKTASAVPSPEPAAIAC